MSTQLIDGDIIVYRAAFAAERASYTLVVGEESYGPFDNKRDLTSFIKERKFDDFVIEKERIVEPVENALSNCKNTVEKLLTDGVSRIFLSGKNNYRRLFPEYKANRDKSMKPRWYDECVIYLVKNWGAEIIDGCEADDAIGMASNQGTLITTIDKDLDMLPGLHYNWVKEKQYEISEFSAYWNFCSQMLTGDTTDNIRGIAGIGPVTAAKLLSPCTTFGALDKVVNQSYEDTYGHGWEKEYLKNKTLLWICRSQQDLEQATRAAKELNNK
jgi:hypothetical protein